MTPYQKGAEAMRERCARECEREREKADKWPKTDLNIGYNIACEGLGKAICALKVEE